jgi:hypothetical protein
MATLVNASAIIMKPKQAFYDWLTGASPSSTADSILDDLRANATVIAIPFSEMQLKADFEKCIAAHSNEIIAIELSRYGLSKPASDDASLMKEWFDISYHARVFAFGPEDRNPPAK